MTKKRDREIVENLENKLKEFLLMGAYIDSYSCDFSKDDISFYSAGLRVFEYLDLLEVTVNDKDKSIKIKTKLYE